MDNPIQITLKRGDWIDKFATCYIVSKVDNGCAKGFITGRIATSKSLPFPTDLIASDAQYLNFEMWFNQEVNGFEAGFDIIVTVLISNNEVKYRSGKPLLRHR